MARSSIFDMIGPVMIGPSSSHTAGVVRIGRVVRRLLGEEPKSIVVTWYNSFATTFEGHGSDRALMAGLLDYKTDDDRIRESMDIAAQKGITHTFRTVASNAKLHPNSIRILAIGEAEKRVEAVGVSRGGGLISIVEVDGFHAQFTAQYHTLLVEASDVPGSITFITNILLHEQCNIATMTVSRRARNDLAKLIIEMDSGIRPITEQYLASLNWVNSAVYIPDIDM